MTSPGEGAEKLLELIPEARREVLKLLKRRGPLPVDAVAEEMGITVSGARQHLSGLEKEGVLTYDRVREGPGRPKHVYRLTELGEKLFPRDYAGVTREILGYLRESDPNLLDKLFVRRAKRRVREARREVEGRPFEEQVRALADMLDREGYMPRVEPLEDNGFRIVERNCLAEAIGGEYRGACAAEMSFLRNTLPGADIRRVSHAVNGQPCCAYEIRPGQGIEGRNRNRTEQAAGRGVDR